MFELHCVVASRIERFAVQLIWWWLLSVSYANVDRCPSRKSRSPAHYPHPCEPNWCQRGGHNSNLRSTGRPFSTCQFYQTNCGRKLQADWGACLLSVEHIQVNCILILWHAISQQKKSKQIMASCISYCFCTFHMHIKATGYLTYAIQRYDPQRTCKHPKLL